MVHFSPKKSRKYFYFRYLRNTVSLFAQVRKHPFVSTRDSKQWKDQKLLHFIQEGIYSNDCLLNPIYQYQLL